MRWALLLACACMALAGCTESEKPSKASLSFDDAGDGVHMDSADCTKNAALYGGGTVDQGEVQVTISDGEGNEVFQQSYDDPIDIELDVPDGADGPWELRAERQDGFEGEYLFTLLCK